MLQSPNWQNKRQEILERDNYTCQRCGIDQRIDLSPWEITLSHGICHSPIIGEVYMHIGVSSYQHLSIATIKVCIYKFQHTIRCKSHITPSQLQHDVPFSLLVNFFADEQMMNAKFKGSLLEQREQELPDPDTLKEYVQRAFYRETEHELGDLIDIQGIYLIPRHQKAEFTKSRFLHVHHLCYRKNVAIWAQDNSEYVTLCNICHRITHEHALIPYYNEHGDAYQTMIPCWKCGGIRFFECYKNIDGGICYACMGKGYQIDTALS